MIWTVKTEPTPQAGDLKIETKFAWWPKKIGDKKVWLESYQLLYEWRVKERALPYFRGMSKTYYFTCGAWDLINEKIKNNE